MIVILMNQLCSLSTRFITIWKEWGYLDSNQEPRNYEFPALPLSYSPFKMPFYCFLGMMSCVVDKTTVGLSDAPAYLW